MNSQKNIQDELKSLQSGLPITNSPVLSVPEGYFEGLASSILAKAKASEAPVQTELAEISPLLADISKVMPYSVPLFYFEQNAELIPDFSQEPQLSFLHGVSKDVPYKIPQDYFELLPGEMLKKMVQPSAKVTPLFARKWMRIAVAAVIGSAMFVGSFKYFTNESSRDVANTSIDTAHNLLTPTALVIEQEIKKASTKELAEFIQNVGINVKTSKTKIAPTEKNNVKDLLKDVSDSEMEAFLSALPTHDEELFVTD